MKAWLIPPQWSEEYEREEYQIWLKSFSTVDLKIEYQSYQMKSHMLPRPSWTGPLIRVMWRCVLRVVMRTLGWGLEHTCLSPTLPLTGCPPGSKAGSPLGFSVFTINVHALLIFFKWGWSIVKVCICAFYWKWKLALFSSDGLYVQHGRETPG